MKKPNALAIGVSNLEYLNILLTYYPKSLNENFDIYIFIDNKVSLSDVQKVIADHNIPVWDNAEYIIISDLYDYYAEKHEYTGKSKEFLYRHGCLFKILMPIYLAEKFDVKRTYVSDDDVFILNDLSNMFTEYQAFGYKKENLFYLRNSDKYEVLAAFNEIFETSFTLEQVNALSINAGNVIYDHDPKLEYYFKRYVNHPMVHHLFFNFAGYTSWTVEQRFHHFNFHRLLNEGKHVDFIQSKDLRLVLNIDKSDNKTKQLKQVTPSLIHYAVGTKKPIFLRQFLTGIEWKYGFAYEPKYELKDILYDVTWQPPSFKEIQKNNEKNNPVF